MPDLSAGEELSEHPRQSTGPLVGLGVLAVLLAGGLAVRIIWEETTLTMELGPQMVGFSIAHGSWGILLLSPWVLALWILIALVVLGISLRRKRKLSRPYWWTLACAILVIGLLSLPEAFWQWSLIDRFARSTHAADLMCYAAAEGNVRTVSAYLDHGVPLEATNYEGSTSTFTAAAGGSVPVLRLLASRNAKLNATNFYGDSPLEAATENHHQDAIDFLKSHGASQVKGTEEQRQAAAHAFVMKQMYRSGH